MPGGVDWEAVKLQQKAQAVKQLGRLKKNKANPNKTKVWIIVIGGIFAALAVLTIIGINW